MGLDENSAKTQSHQGPFAGDWHASPIRVSSHVFIVVVTSHTNSAALSDGLFFLLLFLTSILGVSLTSRSRKPDSRIRVFVTLNSSWCVLAHPSPRPFLLLFVFRFLLFLFWTLNRHFLLLFVLLLLLLLFCCCLFCCWWWWWCFVVVVAVVVSFCFV